MLELELRELGPLKRAKPYRGQVVGGGRGGVRLCCQDCNGNKLKEEIFYRMKPSEESAPRGFGRGAASVKPEKRKPHTLLMGM